MGVIRATDEAHRRPAHSTGPEGRGAPRASWTPRGIGEDEGARRMQEMCRSRAAEWPIEGHDGEGTGGWVPYQNDGAVGWNPPPTRQQRHAESIEPGLEAADHYDPEASVYRVRQMGQKLARHRDSRGCAGRASPAVDGCRCGGNKEQDDGRAGANGECFLGVQGHRDEDARQRQKSKQRANSGAVGGQATPWMGGDDDKPLWTGVIG